MSIENDIRNLTFQGKKVLLKLGELEGKASISEIEKKSDLTQAAIMRAALTLEEKDLAEIQETYREELTLTEEGRLCVQEDLPEVQLLKTLSEVGSSTIEVLMEKAGIPQERGGISIGWIKRKDWADFTEKNGERLLTITEKGRRALDEEGKDEKLLEKIDSADKLLSDQISADLQEAASDLKRRGLVKSRDRTTRKLSLTEKGKKSLEMGVEIEEKVSQISRDLLLSGDWKGASLREYDVEAPVSPHYPGKLHPQRQVIDQLREILLQMGFKEIKGNFVESEFWNFDALFQAQDHPARNIHDSLSVSKPSQTQLPDEELLNHVKKSHEMGVAGSTGWGYKFDERISRRPIMCSQTTAATVRYLAEQPEPPVKVFCIQRVYRREKIDYQHLAEFPQAEGIVMAPGLNFRNMLGYLKEILVQMGISKVRFRPGYFPYTEPSAEADGYFPELDDWIELLGAGMFRPELLKPLGIQYPVLAWGIGFSRIAMIKMGIEDMRDLHNNDLEWLRKKPLV